MPPLQLGKRRYDAKQKGFGGQTKPIFHKKVVILLLIVTCRRSRPRSWCSVSSARSARPRLRDLLRDARPLRSVRRRTRTLRPIKRIAVFLPFVGRYALSLGACFNKLSVESTYTPNSAKKSSDVGTLSPDSHTRKLLLLFCVGVFFAFIVVIVVQPVIQILF